MYPPYVLVDEGDITLFNSIAALEKYVESPDFQRHIVFDSRGRRYKFKNMPDIRGGRRFCVVPVLAGQVELDDAPIATGDDLISLVKSYLLKAKGTVPNKGGLPEMLREVQALTGLLD